MGKSSETTIPEHSFATGIPEVPVTKQRKVTRPTEHDVLTDFGTARANIAPDRQHPNGTTQHNYAARNRHRTVLQQHCDYWDTDHDGIIWPQDTYIGLRKWGWHPLLALFATSVISGLSYGTVSGWLPDPYFRIYLDRIHRAKHGSDSATYDTEGRYSPQHFENIFSKYDRDNKGGLTLGDVWNLWNGQRVLFDLFGALAVAFEWIAMYLLLWPKDGIMKKEDVRGVFDGSIFYIKAGEVREAREVKEAKEAEQINGKSG